MSAPVHCRLCSTRRSRWDRFWHGPGPCPACRTLQRAAALWGLEVVYWTAVGRAWDAWEGGPALHRRAARALRYALAAQWAAGTKEKP